MNLKRKTLLIKTFILLIVFSFYYFYIFSPQIGKLNFLKETLQDHTEKLEKRKNILNQKEMIDKEYEKLNKEIQKGNNQYFLSIKQDYILTVLNEILENSNVEFDSIEFLKEKKEKLKNQEIYCMKVTLPMQCNYNDLITFLKKIREYKRKIVVDKLQIESIQDHTLSISISLNFYSLSVPMKDSFQHDQEVFKEIDSIKEDPFSPSIKIDEVQVLKSKEMNLTVQETKQEPNISKKILLDGFENINTFFIGSNANIQGTIKKSSQREEGNYSLKVTYDFMSPSRNSIANVVYEDKKISISNKGKLGISIYSFQQNNHKIGIVIKDINGKIYSIPLADTINWTGWRYLEHNLPAEISYPATVERIYMQSINFDSTVKGNFLFDNLAITCE
ncbi:hypothetical protein [Inediibacterium massiliense]|uniref:hypothetical protein n=1 Tax=Inediibacterium massiliense TaxID=1658111 RepID=UPI0006B4C5F8|nr:hypothetical protein [Inediibacterium massiliense]